MAHITEAQMVFALRERQEYLRRLIEEKQKELSRAPEGSLRVSSNGTRKKYYFHGVDGTPDRYLKRSEVSFMKRLAQKSYDEKVLRLAEREEQRVDRLLSCYGEAGIEAQYEKLSAARKTLVEPVMLSDQDFAEQWMNAPYQKKVFWENGSEYYTDRQERVRSKSEILIANALLKNGVPYRYEPALFLEDGSVIHPDFQVVNVRIRKEYYWEHFGMMDDQDYVLKAMQRLDRYERNGLYLGRDLIITQETSNRPLSTKRIGELIEGLLL